MPYPVRIRGVLDALGSHVSVSDVIRIAPIALGDLTFVPTDPASFDVTLSYVGAGIVAEGDVRARFHTVCSRCLCDFDLDAVGIVDGFYVEKGEDAGIPEEQEREYIVEETIDLEPSLVQSLVMDLPFAPLHSPECLGICPSCGADLNEGPCGCVAETGDLRFAALEGLREEGPREPAGDGPTGAADGADSADGADT